jgi:hypothetical protein
VKSRGQGLHFPWRGTDWNRESDKPRQGSAYCAQWQAKRQASNVRHGSTVQSMVSRGRESSSASTQLNEDPLHLQSTACLHATKNEKILYFAKLKVPLYIELTTVVLSYTTLTICARRIS